MRSGNLLLNETVAGSDQVTSKSRSTKLHILTQKKLSPQTRWAAPRRNTKFLLAAPFAYRRERTRARAIALCLCQEPQKPLRRNLCRRIGSLPLRAQKACPNIVLSINHHYLNITPCVNSELL